jgi:photosystem II stability/assembly factor-like uncharacterized protein
MYIKVDSPDHEEVPVMRYAAAAVLGGLVWLGAAEQAQGGLGRWTVAGGLPGGKVVVVAANPADAQLVFAGTMAAGLFRSRDGGASWEPAPGLPRQGRAEIVVFDPRRPLRVIAEIDSQAFESADGGESWVGVAGGPYDGSLRALAFAPGDSRVVYAVTGQQGTLRSSDGGTRWEPRAAVPQVGGSLAVSPFDPNLLFVGSFRSADGGQSWSGTGPSPGAGETRVRFDPLHPGVALAAVIGVGVFRSDDGGASWRGVTPPIAGGVYAVQDLIFSADGGTVFVSAQSSFEVASFFQQSHDGGLTWTPPTAAAAFVADRLAADPTGRRRLFAATGEGVYWSRDGGRGWTARSAGLVAAKVADLVADPVLAATFYAVNGAGALSRSRDGGATWQSLRGGIQGPLAVDPQGSILYAGAAMARQLVRGSAGGESWTVLPMLSCVLYSGMAVDPLSSLTLYVLALNKSPFCPNFSGGGLFKSVDGGATATLLPTAPVIADLAIGAPGRTLYGRAFGGAARSDDGGATWSVSSPDPAPAGGIVNVALSRDAGWLYLSGREGAIFRSEDGGQTWVAAAPSPLGGSAPLFLVADPHVPTTVYGIGGKRFFRSLDGGASWVEHSAGMRRFGLTGPLVLDPGRAGRLLAGTPGGQVLEIELP